MCIITAVDHKGAEFIGSIQTYKHSPLHASRLKVKVKVHTLDIAPLRSESPPQKRSGMARVL